MPANKGREGEAASAPEIEMFSGPGCTYCAQSRALLQGHGLSFVEYDVSDPADLAEYRKRLPRASSIPQIFIDGEHIGSFEDLQLMADRGDLARPR